MIAAVTLAVAIAAPDAYAIYSRARNRWASQAYPPFLSYVVRTSGTEASRGITNTYQSFVDTANNAITVRATSAEEAAHPYVPHGVNIRTKATLSYTRHPQLFSAPTIEGSGDLSISKTMRVTPEQQYDLLGVPLLSPTYSFGLAPVRTLTNSTTAPVRPSPVPDDLKTIAMVTAVRSDYDIRLEGTDIVDDLACYHLQLTPRHEPGIFRLRELWIDEDGFTTRQALVQGNFRQGPGPRLRWLIHYVVRDGLMYISSEVSQGKVNYLGHTYANVTVTFSDIESASSPGVSWTLSMFRTSGDVLQEP